MNVQGIWAVCVDGVNEGIAIHRFAWCDDAAKFLKAQKAQGFRAWGERDEFGFTEARYAQR